MSADTRNDSAYRKRHRELFNQIWNDTRVCSLAELQRRPETERKHCQLVYTFVIGAATATAADKNEIINNATTTTTTTTTTQIVDASVPLYRSTPLKSKFPDVNDDDVTLLNIKYVFSYGWMDGWMDGWMALLLYTYCGCTTRLHKKL